MSNIEIDYKTNTDIHIVSIDVAALAATIAAGKTEVTQSQHDALAKEGISTKGLTIVPDSNAEVDASKLEAEGQDYSGQQ